MIGILRFLLATLVLVLFGFFAAFLGFLWQCKHGFGVGEEARSGEVVESGGYSIKEKQNKRMRERERGKGTAS